MYVIEVSCFPPDCSHDSSSSLVLVILPFQVIINSVGVRYIDASKNFVSLYEVIGYIHIFMKQQWRIANLPKFLLIILLLFFIDIQMLFSPIRCHSPYFCCFSCYEVPQFSVILCNFLLLSQCDGHKWLDLEVLGNIFKWQTSNSWRKVTILLKHDYRRPTFSSGCDVISDVQIWPTYYIVT